MQEIISAISQVGFPIAISVYLLVRFEKKLETLTKSINELNNQIKDLTKTIERSK